MKRPNTGQHNPIHRQYSEVIAAAKNKSYRQASKQAKQDGEKRRLVDEMMEQRRLQQEIDLWITM